MKLSCLVKVSDDLTEEIHYWHFLDSWEGNLPWLPARHVHLKVFSDASDSAWGGVICTRGSASITTRNFWPSEMLCFQLLLCRLRLLSLVSNAWVDAHTDSLPFLHSRQNQGGKSKLLHDMLKFLHKTVLAYNSTLSFYFAPSESNITDTPRELSDSDCMLSEQPWWRAEQHFRPHTLDLMSLDSNVKINFQGHPLWHITPFFTPQSCGVNLFA